MEIESAFENKWFSKTRHCSIFSLVQQQVTLHIFPYIFYLFLCPLSKANLGKKAVPGHKWKEGGRNQ